MSSSLITQTIDSSPEILLIGQSRPLLSVVAEIFVENGLQAVVETDLNQVDTDKNWYKLVWVDDLSLLSDLEVSKTTSFLKQLKCPQMLLSFVFRPIEESRTPVLKSWINSNNKTYFNINKVLTDLSEISLCLGQDVFDQRVENPLLKLQKDNLALGYLLDPQVTLTAQTLNNFVKASSVFLISPWNREQILIQGRKIYSQKIINEIKFLYGQLNQVDLPIEKFFVSEIEALEGFRVEKSDAEFQLDELVGFFVKKLPKVKPEKKKPDVIGKKKASSRIFPPDKKETVHAVNNTPDSNSSQIRLINIPKISLVSQKNNEDLPKIRVGDQVLKEKKASKIDPKIDQQVEKIFKSTQVEHKVDRVEKIADQSQTFVKKSNRKKIAFIGGVFFSGLGLGVIVLFLTLLSSTFLFKKSFASALEGSLIEEKNNIFSSQSLDILAKVVDIQTSAYSSVLGQELFSDSISLVDVYQKLDLAQQSLDKTETLVVRAVKYLFGRESGDAFAAVQSASNEAESAYKNLSLVSASLEQFSQGNGFDQQVLSQVNDHLLQQRKSLATLQQLQPMLPTLLAENGRRTYAVLIQDNQELRATGGFIHSVVLITVENGLLIDHQSYSSYQLDNNVSGGVAVPEEINKYLGETNWYFRDANWDPNFSTTAQQIAWFIQKSTGRTIDGVIGLNIYVMEDMIRALGPLEMDQYNEVLTDKNIHERAEFHSEVQLADSSKDEDYLTAIFESLYQRMLLSDENEIPKLLAVLEDNLNQGQLFFSLMDSQENQSIATLGWTGDILSPSCPTEFEEPCFVDSFYKVESNVGVNKANYNLQRSITDQITLTEQSVSHDRTIKITNNSKSKAWPQGNYKSYLRFYLPKNAQLEEVLIENNPVDMDNVSQQVAHGKKVIGVYLEVPISSTVTLDLKYQIPFDQKYASYSLFDQRQAGIDQQPTNIIVSHLPTSNPILIAPQAEVVDDSVKFYTDHLKHFFLGIGF